MPTKGPAMTAAIADVTNRARARTVNPPSRVLGTTFQVFDLTRPSPACRQFSG
jgi:hypothetical protein